MRSQVAKPINDRSASQCHGILEAVRIIKCRRAEDQQTVVLLRMQWYDPTKKNQRLPNAVAADLAAKLETTPENFRNIYERAMRQLKEKLPTATPVSQKGR